MTKPVLLALVLLGVMALADCKRSGSKPRPIISAYHLIMRPESAEVCSKNGSVSIERIEFKKNGNAVNVNGEGFLHRDVDRITKVVAYIKNCDDSSPWSCRHFQTWRYGKESCVMMAKKDVFWTPFVQNVQPELKCPLKMGRYTLRNGTLDVDLLRQLPYPLEKYFWRVQLEAYDTTDMFLCLKATARFVRS